MEEDVERLQREKIKLRRELKDLENKTKGGSGDEVDDKLRKSVSSLLPSLTGDAHKSCACLHEIFAVSRGQDVVLRDLWNDTSPNSYF